jgi:muramoyltetrapeptide carboxypeptidase
MRFKYNLIFLVILCTGCAPFCKKKAEFNSALNDPHFQAALQPYTIQVVAPASGVDLDEVNALQSLKSLNIQIPRNLISNAITFHSNSDHERFRLLKKALISHQKNDIIWCLRGGYGSARIIDKLKTLPKPKTNKLFIGYSDITALHLFLSEHWGWKTVHGSVLVEILNSNKDPKNFYKLADIISRNVTELTLEPLKPLNNLAMKSTKVSGRLTGGNLSIVQTSLGTDWQIKAAKKILFLEEVGEKGYQIDRSLNHLKQSGILNQTKAIVFGDCVDCKEDAFLALEWFSAETKIPVFKTEQFGHGKVNYPMVYNIKAEIVPIKDTKDFTLIMYLKD